MLGQNCLSDSEGDFFKKFYLTNFSLFIASYHAAKFEKIIKLDPEMIKACIIFAHKWPKITHWFQNRDF